MYKGIEIKVMHVLKMNRVDTRLQNKFYNRWLYTCLLNVCYLKISHNRIFGEL